MTDEDIMKRFDEGSRQFQEIREQLGEVLKALEPIPQMKADIEKAMEDSEAVKDIVQTWNALKTGGKFVKWVAPVIGSVAGAWAAIKLGIARILS